MVDTRDLKSLGQFGCAGSIPAPGTEAKSVVRSNSATDFVVVGGGLSIWDEQTTP